MAHRIFRGVAVRARPNAFGRAALVVEPRLAHLLADFVGLKVEVEIRVVRDKTLRCWTGTVVRFKNGRPE